jgi:hypothetical protein
MAHKPRIAVRDPFPGQVGARLARRRLLALAGHLIDDLIVVTTSEREVAVAAARGRRHGIDVLVHAPGLESVAAARLAERAGAAGVVLPAGDIVGVGAALDHGRVMVEATGPELAGVAHLDPRAEMIWRPCAVRLPHYAPSAVAAVAGRPALVELAPAGWSITPCASAWHLHAAGAAGIVAQPPCSPDAAAIWLDALLGGDREGAIRRALAGRCSADAATCVASLADGGPQLDAACQSFERGDGMPLAALLDAWSRAADEVARLEDRRLARALAPSASVLHAIGRAGRYALEGDHRAAWDVYHAGIDEHEELAGAAGRLLACVTA